MPEQDISPDERAALRALARRSWARTVDRSARTAPAREAFERRFLDAADGDPTRAADLRTSYFRDLAQKSLQSRRKRGGDA